MSSSEEVQDVTLLELFEWLSNGFGDWEELLSSVIVSSGVLSLLFNFLRCLYSVIDN